MLTGKPAIKAPTEYIASLLWIFNQCLHSKSLRGVFSQKKYLSELVKHMLLNEDEAVQVLAFRIVRKIAVETSDPASFAEVFNEVPKDLLGEFCPASELTSFLSVMFYLASLRHTSSIELSRIPKQTRQRMLSYEAFEFLLNLTTSKPWADEIIMYTQKLVKNAALAIESDSTTDY
jgi:hypothetical protein